MANSIQLRRDTEANWSSVNPVLKQGEAGFETDTNKLKFGDGSTAWNSLKYIASSSNLGGTTERNTVLAGGLKLDTVPTKGFGIDTWTGTDDTIYVDGPDMATGNNGGFVWGKARTGDTNIGHYLVDTVRGGGAAIQSNTTAKESFISVNEFTANGFTAIATGAFSISGQTYVGWMFQTTEKTTGYTGDGTNNGTNKPYTAHYNPAMGFSIIGYEGSSSINDIPNHLGDTADVVIVKSRDSATDWHVSAQNVGATSGASYLKLNDSDDVFYATNGGLEGAYSSDKFRVRENNPNNIDGENCIAYCFRSVPGFSKIRTYVGTGANSSVILEGMDFDNQDYLIDVKVLSTGATNGGWYRSYRGDTGLVTEITGRVRLDELFSEATVIADGVGVVSVSGDTAIIEGLEAGKQYLIMAFTPNYNKPTDGIPYVEAGTIVTHAEGFDENGAKDYVEVKPYNQMVYTGDDNKYVYVNIGQNPYYNPNTPSVQAPLDTDIMMGNGKLYLGEVKWMDGKAFTVEPVKRTAITQQISDGTNSVTPAELRAKCDEPYIGVDGELVSASCRVASTGALSRANGISAVVKITTGIYDVYFTDEYDLATLRCIAGITFNSNAGFVANTRSLTSTGFRVITFNSSWTLTDAETSLYIFGRKI